MNHNTSHYIQILHDPGLRILFAVAEIANGCTQNLEQYGQTEFHFSWLSLCISEALWSFAFFPLCEDKNWTGQVWLRTKLRGSYSPKHKHPEVGEVGPWGVVASQEAIPRCIGPVGPAEVTAWVQMWLAEQAAQWSPPRPRSAAFLQSGAGRPEHATVFVVLREAGWQWAAGAECNMPGCAPWPGSPTTMPLPRGNSSDLPGPCRLFHFPICTSRAAETSQNQNHQPSAKAARKLT